MTGLQQEGTALVQVNPSPPTLAKVLEAVQKALLAKTIIVEMLADAGSMPPPYLELRADPAYKLLLALVQEKCLIGPYHKRHYGPLACQGTGFVLRTAYWEAAPNGALAGTFLQTLGSLSPKLPTRGINLPPISWGVRGRNPDLEILEAVLAWLTQEAEE